MATLMLREAPTISGSARKLIISDETSEAIIVRLDTPAAKPAIVLSRENASALTGWLLACMGQGLRPDDDARVLVYAPTSEKDRSTLRGAVDRLARALMATRGDTTQGRSLDEWLAESREHLTPAEIAAADLLLSMDAGL